MKRRGFFKTLAALPAAPALIAETPPPQARSGESNIPAFPQTSQDLVADTVPRFFTADQYAALRRLSALFMPRLDDNPGAIECEAPEFLDFLISVELPERQNLYRGGLDMLNASAKKKFKKGFADLNDADADAIVRPLLKPVAWEYDPPKNPSEHFIAQAHRDIRTATQNSREWATAGASSGRRRFGGAGVYVTPIDPIY